jgi:hypothetical protein
MLRQITFQYFGFWVSTGRHCLYCYLYMYAQFRLAQVLPERSCGLRRSVQCATSGHGNFGTLSMEFAGEHGRGNIFVKITLEAIWFHCTLV